MNSKSSFSIEYRTGTYSDINDNKKEKQNTNCEKEREKKYKL